MRLRGAILFAALLASSASASAQSVAETAFQQLRFQARGAAPTCESSYGEIAYVGPTDEGLVACLEEHPGATALRITSLGGPVVPAIVAARMIAAREMDVTVLGFCGSSCGNYIAAAARRLTVLEDSAIMLHGAPLADPESQREQAFAALFNAGIPENRITDAMLDEAAGILQGQRDFHDGFAAEFAVGSEWYDLNDYYEALERLPGRGPQLLVSPDFAQACLGYPEIGDYWYPQTAGQRDRLWRLIGSPVMFMGADLPTPASCGQ